MKYLCLCITLFVSAHLSATDYYWKGSASNADWHDPANWTPNGVPADSSDRAFFMPPNTAQAFNCTISQNTEVGEIRASYNFNKQIVLAGTAELHVKTSSTGTNGAFRMDRGRFVADLGDVTIEGNLFLASHAGFTSTQGNLTLKGDSISIVTDLTQNGGKFTHNSGKVIFSGANTQYVQRGHSIDPPGQFSLGAWELYQVDINNTQNVILACDVNIEDSLGLDTGKVILDGGNLQMRKAAGPSSIHNSNAVNYIVTNDQWELRYRLDASFLTANNPDGIVFPIGNTAGISPLVLHVTDATLGSNARLGCNVATNSTGMPPLVNLNPVDYLERYWTVSEFDFSQSSSNPDHVYDVEYTYLPADVQGNSSSISPVHYSSANAPYLAQQHTNASTQPQVFRINGLRHTGSQRTVGIFGGSDHCLLTTDITYSGYLPALCNPGVAFELNGATPETAGVTYGFSWSGPSGFSSTLQDIATSTAGTYTLEVTETAGGSGCKGWTEETVFADVASSTAYTPIAYFTFESCSTGAVCPSNTGNPNCSSTPTPGTATFELEPVTSANGGIITPAESGVYPEGIVGNFLSINKADRSEIKNIDWGTDKLTFECLFRLHQDFTNGHLFISTGFVNEAPVEIQILPTYLLVRSRLATGSTPQNTNRVLVNFDGLGRKSLAYYLDDAWHHIAVTIDAAAGTMRVWVDGQSPDGFSHNDGESGVFQTPAYSYLGNSAGITNINSSSLRNIGFMDEVAVYDVLLPEAMIYQHYLETAGAHAIGDPTDHYSCSTTLTPCDIPSPDPLTGPMDEREFPIGFDPNSASTNLSRSPLIQLRSFPFPRYYPENTLLRNFPWFDYDYLSGRIATNVPNGAPHNPVHNTYIWDAYYLMEEFADHWNYYLHFNNASWANSPYRLANYDSDDNAQFNSIPKAFTRLANARPDLPLAAISLWTGTSPQTLDPNLPVGAYVRNNSLTSHHYLIDNNGTLIKTPWNANIWSPDAPLDELTIDGQAMASYFENIYRFLDRPVTIINENGEEPGPKICKIDGSDCTGYTGNCVLCTSTYSSNFPIPMSYNSIYEFTLQRKVDFRTTYRDEFMNLPQHAQTQLTWYQLDENSGHFIGKAASLDPVGLGNGEFLIDYTTPDVYPKFPRRWNITAEGAAHGLGWLENDRQFNWYEGNKLFSPFVSAGWNRLPQQNIRPGQWLGLLKIMGLYGAEFFYTGYFSGVEKVQLDSDPEWEYYFQDPKAWVWQTVMPAYAQATLSRFEELIKNGEFPEVSNSGNNELVFDLPGTGANNRVAARYTLNGSTPDKFVLSGTIQRQTNYIGEVVNTAPVTATLPNGSMGFEEELTFEIRLQGSTYIYDKSNVWNPSQCLFYQVDKWHESIHPERWTKDYQFEAEVFDGLQQHDVNAFHSQEEWMGISTYYQNPGNQEWQPIDCAASLAKDLTTFTTYIDFPNAEVDAPVSWANATDRPHVDYQFRSWEFDQDIVDFGTASYEFWARVRCKQNDRNSNFTGFDVQVLDKDGKVVHSNRVVGIEKAAVQTANHGWVWHRQGLCGKVSIEDLEKGYYTLRILPLNNLLELDQLVLDADSNFNPSDSVIDQPQPYPQVTQDLEAAFRYSSTCAHSGTSFTNLTNVSVNGCSSGTVQYSWDFGDGSVSSLEHPTHTYASSGDYEVTLIVNISGISGYTTTLDTVIDTIQIDPALSVMLNNLSGTTTPCTGTGVELVANPSGGSDPYSFKWTPSTAIEGYAVEDTNDTVTAIPWYTPIGQTGPGVSFNDSSSTWTYQVIVTDSSGCRDTNQIELTPTRFVVEATISSDSVYVDPSPNGLDTLGVTVISACTSCITPASPLTYSWTPTGPLNTSSIADPLIHSPFLSSNLFTVVVTDNNGCIASDQVMHTVLRDSTINKHAITDQLQEGSPSNQQGDEASPLPGELRLYPNPTTGNVTLSYTVEHPGHVRILLFSAMGAMIREVRNAHTEKGPHQEYFALPSESANGIYFVVFEQHDSVKVKRLVLGR